MEKDCSNREQNKERCTCKSVDCKNHGICCECIRRHADNNNLPFCLRKESA